jgi:hypothetical protein
LSTILPVGPFLPLSAPLKTISKAKSHQVEL